MNNFDLKKYLTEGRLLKEEMLQEVKRMQRIAGIIK